MRMVFISVIMVLAGQAGGHSGGLNKQGCHAGSQLYHCHKPKSTVSKKVPDNANIKTLSGTVTHVRDGDTIEVDGTAIRLVALNCPENGTKKGNYATAVAKKFAGAEAMCELTGAKTYDRLVGYCIINGTDFGKYMMKNSSCKVWEKFDVLDRY